MPFVILLFIILVIVSDMIGIRLLQSPLIVSAVIGTYLQKPELALSIGSSLEIFRFVLAQDGGMIGFYACIMTIYAAKVDSTSLLPNAIPLLMLCLSINVVYEMCVSLLTEGVRKRVASKPRESFSTYLFFPMFVKVILQIVSVYYFYAHTEILTALFSSLEKLRPVYISVLLIGYALPFVGVAVVLRNLSLKNHYAALFAGCATAMLSVSGGEIGGVVAGVFAIGLCVLLYKQHQPVQESQKEAKGVKEKWW